MCANAETSDHDHLNATASWQWVGEPGAGRRIPNGEEAIIDLAPAPLVSKYRPPVAEPGPANAPGIVMT